MRAAITLPGTIPGLLRRGSPVIHAEHGAGVCIFTPRSPEIGPAVGFMGPGDMCQFMEVWVSSDAIALDLTDPTGRAHAVWWLWNHANDGVDIESACAAALGLSHEPLDWLNGVWAAAASGSKRLDAEALRLVCLRVAGVAP